MMFGLDFIALSMKYREEKRQKNKLIYLAGPYTHKNKTIQNQREKALTKKAAEMVSLGKHVWSPITESHQYSKVMGLNTNWEFWKGHDLLMLSKCDELHVLMLPGWDLSVGVTAEIKEAKRLKMPIHYIDGDE